jgi:hypothetical protein
MNVRHPLVVHGQLVNPRRAAHAQRYEHASLTLHRSRLSHNGADLRGDNGPELRASHSSGRSDASEMEAVQMAK